VVVVSCVGGVVLWICGDLVCDGVEFELYVVVCLGFLRCLGCLLLYVVCCCCLLSVQFVYRCLFLI